MPPSHPAIRVRLGYVYNACYVSVSTVPAAACLYLQCLLRVFVHKVCSTEDWLILTGTRSRERNVRRSSLYTGPPLHTLAHPQYIIVHRLYIAPVSALQQNRCAHVARDSQ